MIFYTARLVAGKLVRTLIGNILKIDAKRDIIDFLLSAVRANYSLILWSGEKVDLSLLFFLSHFLSFTFSLSSLSSFSLISFSISYSQLCSFFLLSSFYYLYHFPNCPYILKLLLFGSIPSWTHTQNTHTHNTHPHEHVHSLQHSQAIPVELFPNSN